HGLDRKVARALPGAVRRGVTGVYAYEDGALEAFTKAKEFGLKCFYDLPTGHWRAARRLLEAERTLWPEWEMTLGYFQDSETKLARKDKELNLADMIITASTFTASTLKEFPGELPPVKVIPYGFPVVMEGPKS